MTELRGFGLSMLYLAGLFVPLAVFMCAEGRNAIVDVDFVFGGAVPFVVMYAAYYVDVYVRRRRGGRKLNAVAPIRAG